MDSPCAQPAAALSQRRSAEGAAWGRKNPRLWVSRVALMCGMILYDTSRLINGGEANPVMVVIALFADIVVLFSHLLSLFSFLSGDD